MNITPWLDGALKANMPYNQFVSDLLSGKKETEAFLRMIFHTFFRSAGFGTFLSVEANDISAKGSRIRF